MVNPKGRLVTLEGEDTKVAAHAMGTTGIVTWLEIMRNPQKILPFLYFFDNIIELEKFLMRAYDEALPFYHLSALSPSAMNYIFGLDGRWGLLGAVEEDVVEEVPKGADGKEIWRKRSLFNSGMVEYFIEKGERPFYTVYKVDVDQVSEFISKAGAEVKSPMFEMNLTNEGKARILTISSVPFHVDFYGDSLFNVNSPYINNRVTPSHLNKIKMYKRLYDKEDLFNPGKIRFDK